MTIFNNDKTQLNYEKTENYSKIEILQICAIQVGAINFVHDLQTSKMK